MNSTNFVKVGVIVVGILVGITIVGSIILTIHRPDATATFVSQMSTLIGLVTVAAGVFYGFSKQGERLEGIENTAVQIEHNVNGKMSKAQQERDTARDTLRRMGLDEYGNPLPDTGTTPTQDGTV